MSAFDKVIGYNTIKEKLFKACDAIKNHEVYEKLGAKAPKGILIEGDPGLGKTLMAKCFIEECGLPSFIVRKEKGGDNFIDYITDIFDQAEEQAPSIVLLDDMDKYANDDLFHSDSSEYVAIQAAIDDMRDKEVYVIATVNNGDKLPKSLRRSGRFDIRINVDRPEGKDAEDIIKYYLSDKTLSDDVNIDDVSKMISHSSCAELEAILNTAALNAAYNRNEHVAMEDIVKAVLDKAYDSNNDIEQVSEEKLALTALHEAGHLVAHEILMPDSVGFASINTCEGSGRGGYVHICKVSDRRPHSVICALGGKAAVELKYCDRVASGCHSDLNKALKLVEQGITGSGTNGLAYLKFNAGYGEDDASPDKLHAIETVTTAELEKYMLKTKDILLKNKDFLEKAAAELAKKHYLLHSDIQRIKSEVTITPVTI